MTPETEVAWHLDEVHSFFPEWADRPASSGRFVEFDRNSYLAGGYSEEFGHHAEVNPSPVDPHLTPEPERCPQWQVQVDCLHPGYPECPRPCDRDGLRSAAHATPVRGEPNPAVVGRSTHGSSGDGDGSKPIHRAMSIIRVGQHPRSRHVGFAAPLASWWLRWRIHRRELGRFI